MGQSEFEPGRDGEERPVADRLEALLRESPRPVTALEASRRLEVPREAVRRAVAALVAEGRVARTAEGLVLLRH